MDGPGTAKRDHIVSPGVTAFFSQMHPGRSRHVFVDDIVDTNGCFQCRQPERFGDFLDNRFFHRRHIEGHFSPQEIIRVQVTQIQIRIGNGRVLTAQAITYGTRC